MLERKGRSTAAWKEALCALPASGSYRAGHIQPDDLAALVEDAAASPERRVAAAVALASSPGEPARRRIRIAAETCADPDLRIALEHAAEGEIEEEALERAQRRVVAGPGD